MAESLSRTIHIIEHGIADGLHAGAQLYVSREFVPVADVGIGESRIGESLCASFITGCDARVAGGASPGITHTRSTHASGAVHSARAAHEFPSSA